MRVVFLEDVDGVARGGDVKEVKNGFARNYLIPKSLAVPATHNALQGVERLAGEADVTRVKRLEDVKALAAELNGFQVNIDMRAGSGGRLYGSVTNVMIAEALAELTDREIDRRIIEIEEPIRRMGNFEVNVRLDAEVEAKINVLVYPTGTDPLAQDEDAETAHGDAAEADDPPVAEAKPAGPEAKDDDESGSDGEADAEADEA
jgi:large subunit ribosomal protein L9